MQRDMPLPTEMPNPTTAAVFLLLCGALRLWSAAQASVVFIDHSNVSSSFNDMEASFAPRIPSTGIEGRLYVAEPLNACKPVKCKEDNETSGFLLIERGDCPFATKIQHARDAGYAAAIVYDDEDSEDLITMSGYGERVEIYAVFITKGAGDMLCSSADETKNKCYVFPTFEKAAKSFIVFSFITLLTCFAIFSTLFFVRRHQYRQAIATAQAKGMAWKDVKTLTTIIFDNAIKEYSLSCAICLEDYGLGERLRVLPCGHEFHGTCIDQWLTTRKCFCPICKADAHSKMCCKIPSEHTPLLASFTSNSI